MIRRRLQLSLVHLAVAMTLVPINSTLNRVMIKELAFSATLVAVLASLPYVFSPLQMVIGSYSDRHPWLGWRRSPYIALGLLFCVSGVALAPQAVYLVPVNRPLGLALSLLVFAAWGMGFNLASVAYLSLASELSGESGRSRTVAVMWFVMIVGIIVTAATLSRMLDPYSPQTLERAFIYVALAALALGAAGLLGLEQRSAPSGETPRRVSWLVLGRNVFSNPQARHFFFYLIVLLSAILGQDVLLEPFAAEAFDLSVSATTRITSIWGGCVLAALLVAGALERRLDKRAVAEVGAWGALVGFIAIAGGGLAGQRVVFYAGVTLLGLATGLATVANLSLMLDMTSARVGLYIGVWGMADALARLFGSLLSGGLRDLGAHASGDPLLGYGLVFFVEAALMLLSWFMLRKVNVARFRNKAQSTGVVERAALLDDAG